MQPGTGSPMLRVRPWMGPGTLSAAALKADAGPLVLGITTPDTSIRANARVLARNALQDALGILLGRPAREVPLISEPGQPIRLGLPAPRIGLSVSHEPGLTLAAIHLGKEIGVDLMRIDQRPDWLSDWETVARDYLGPQAAARIARLPPAEQAHAFARAWTGLEASLKCHGLPLQEWAPALECTLARCQLFELDLPATFAGTLAVRSA